ncbi:MAG: hypothetical protein F6K50_45505, partial [Moorea sp. SIO3I7]|nr:hypothetical protein [Moorena sp. SIO3I7]
GAWCSKKKYQDLYNVIYNSFNKGEEQEGKFRLPDLRGRVVVGVDLEAEEDEMQRVGGTGGEYKVKLTKDQLAAHSHDVNMDHNHILRCDKNGSGGETAKNLLCVASSQGFYTNRDSYFGKYEHEIEGEVGNKATKDEGNNDKHNNIQPYLTVHYIIKY